MAAIASTTHTESVANRTTSPASYKDHPYTALRSTRETKPESPPSTYHHGNFDEWTPGTRSITPSSALPTASHTRMYEAYLAPPYTPRQPTAAMCASEQDDSAAGGSRLGEVVIEMGRLGVRDAVQQETRDRRRAKRRWAGVLRYCRIVWKKTKRWPWGRIGWSLLSITWLVLAGIYFWAVH
ncbi:hypothetical protein K461DRAFT_269463 [Myriangium duriaei CBS 260.36]|uniref:Uncharacterized protein n=1 Tax=Myriangium duriaei CBS 260.36 TaxID=1168546 RepID=A0A9P4IZ81_9PEZI|nr:hypothetical protein K461DRAFT_269463 [Myriangium duriaei CBS 260.36]